MKFWTRKWLIVYGLHELGLVGQVESMGIVQNVWLIKHLGKG